jgi:hypothetical protein
MSGAGKSTMADLWAGRTGANVLSDDRVIVRRNNGGFWMYGTPWHGDAQMASPDGAPLKQIFTIRHSSRNRSVPLGTADAASKLLARSFPTFWDADGMAFTVDFLGQLAQSVPCNELGFVPSPDIVDFVRCESAP